MHRATTSHGGCRRQLAMAFAVLGLVFNPWRRSGAVIVFDKRRVR